jgi:predicted aspartyl protease
MRAARHGGVRHFVLITVLVLTTLAHARAGSRTPPEFPFELRGGLLWVKVSVPQSAEPLNFLLDSGAGVSVINLRTAKQLGLKLGQRVDVRGVGNSTDGFWPQRVLATAGGVELPKECLAVDLAELSRACDCGVDGLLGADFFKDRVVQIDFGAKVVRLLPSSNGSNAASVVKLKVNRGALLASVGVDGNKPQWLRVDTGCTSALQWVTNGRNTAARRSGVSVGLTELSIPTTMTTVKLGSMIFDSVPTGLHERAIFSGESGLLGNGLLMRFERVTFDAKAGRLVLDGPRAGF